MRATMLQVRTSLVVRPTLQMTWYALTANDVPRKTRSLGFFALSDIASSENSQAKPGLMQELKSPESSLESTSKRGTIFNKAAPPTHRGRLPLGELPFSKEIGSYEPQT